MRAALAMAALLAGCVPKGRYLELEASYDEAVAERDRAASETEACEAELRDRGEGESARAERQEAAAKRLRGAGAGEVVTKGGRVVLRLRMDPLFAPDTADLSEVGLETAERLARTLDDGGHFLVEAHASGAPANTKEFPTAWHLAGDRAIALVTALVERGVPADHLVAGSSDSGPDRVDVVWIP